MSTTPTFPYKPLSCSIYWQGWGGGREGGVNCVYFRHVRESKTVLDSGFHSLSVELGFLIPFVCGIQNSLSCFPDSASKNFPDSGIQIPLHRATISTNYLERNGFFVAFCFLYKKYMPCLLTTNAVFSYRCTCTWHLSV